jgi:hypothetical protein
MINPPLDRLLRAAARLDEQKGVDVPFGFDTRVVALWRQGGTNGNGNGKAVARLVQRVAILAGAIILVSSAAVVREFSQTRDLGEPMTNEFAMADSAIQDEMTR